MLSSLSLSSPVTSPRSLSQSPPSTCHHSSNLLLSPRSATLRRLSCSSAVCTAVETISCYSSFYDVLGISAAASNDEIKAAYRRLARSCHPDVSVEVNKSAANDAFIQVRDAYTTLSDPRKRADYDRTLFISGPMIGVRLTSSGFCSSPRKNWESDQCW